MDNLYKLSFQNRDQFLTVKASLDNGNGQFPFYAFNEIGNVPIPAVIDEITGEEISPASFHTDWAVDVYSKVQIPELEPYLIPEKESYANMPNGGNWNLIVIPV